MLINHRPALDPDKSAEMPEPFPLERAWDNLRKPTPAIFTGCCCSTNWKERMRNVESMARYKDQSKSKIM